MVILLVVTLIHNRKRNSNTLTDKAMSVYHSNHPHFQPAEHVFFRLYEPCDFCRVSMEEEMLSKVDGYNLCVECKAQYEEDQKNNAELTN